MSFLLSLIATYGYVVVFLVVMAESAGLPLPGETALLVAGGLAGAGQLWLPGVILAAAAGAILGDTAGYWIGRRYGVPLLRRHGRLFRFDEARLEKAQVFFAKHGDKTVFLGRFVPVGRILSAVLAGVSHMRYPSFLFWNATGGIVWATIMGALGYLFGSQLPLVERVVRQFGFGLLALVVLALVARLLITRRGSWLPAARRAWERALAIPRGWSLRTRLISVGLSGLLALGGGLALALLT